MLLLKFIVKRSTWALKPRQLKLKDTIKKRKKKKTSYSVKINVDINIKLIQTKKTQTIITKIFNDSKIINFQIYFQNNSFFFS